MTPARALIAIQTMADHSQKWHDRTTSRYIGSNSSRDGLAALVNKLDNLRRDMKKLKGSVHAIQVGCQICEGPHLDKDCPLNEEVKQVEEEAVTKHSPEEIEYFLANSGFSNDDEFKKFTSIPNEDLTSPKQTTTHYIEQYIPSIPFPRRLEQHAEEALIYKTMESLKKIKSNQPFLKEIKQSNEYPKFMKYLIANKPLTMENEDFRINRRCSALLLNKLPPKEKDPGSFILPCSIGRNNEIRERIIHNLHEEWFKWTFDKEDDIEGIIDYLEPTSYDGFVDLDEEKYNKRRCRLLGMPYVEPLPIIIEQVKITRYSLGPGEVYTKLEASNTEELPRTRNNVATIRSNIMEELSFEQVDRCAPFEALYGRKCRSPVLWVEIGDSGLIGPELVQETTNKVVVIRDRLKIARDLSPKKGVVRFGKKGKLAPRFVGTSIQEDPSKNFLLVAIEIMDREVKTFKRSKIPIVKVRWNSKRGPEFTWEREDHIKAKYPRLFKNAIVETNG
ncbi:hypothetical protein Tco_0815193 [Tanacetum coccineum]